uniref:Hexosyltransferase n=1 Tax=Globodera rostochiensis TaxID=31243 RepID=A0A914IFC7_GLORO
MSGSISRVRMFLVVCTGTVFVFQLYNNEMAHELGSKLDWGAFSNNNTNWKTNRHSDELKKRRASSIETNNNNNHKQYEVRFKNIRLKYRMEFANPCPDQTKLIMLSMARRDGFDKRKGIRQTWMNDSIPGEVIRFLVADALQGEANDTQKRLEEEQTKHGDLVFMHGFEDTYKHIHLKWYGGVQWQQSFCAHAKWVMKTDDDAVVHLRRLAYWTEKTFSQIVVNRPLVYIGHVLYNPAPIRDKNSKWYISEDVYPLDWYPDFLQGTVYLTTSATIAAILPHTREIVGFYLDDVLLYKSLYDQFYF